MISNDLTLDPESLIDNFECMSQCFVWLVTRNLAEQAVLDVTHHSLMNRQNVWLGTMSQGKQDPNRAVLYGPIPCPRP